jgi:hydroxymethylglutaryl-CoA lyase
MAAFGCNFEGDVPLQRVIDLIAKVDNLLTEHAMGISQVTLADTMAWANPLSVKRMVEAVRTRWPQLILKLHLHDTRGLAIANAFAALQEGVRAFDGSLGGLGGYPFAEHKGAAGNICTEDLAFMCEEMGFETGIDLDKLILAAGIAQTFVDHPIPGKVLNGGSLRALRR